MSLRYCAHNAASKNLLKSKTWTCIVVPPYPLCGFKSAQESSPASTVPTYSPPSLMLDPPLRMPVILLDVWMFCRCCTYKSIRGSKPAITTPLAGIGSNCSTSVLATCLLLFAPRACSSRFSSLQACWEWEPRLHSAHTLSCGPEHIACPLGCLCLKLSALLESVCWSCTQK